jgi:hypothetical protein
MMQRTEYNSTWGTLDINYWVFYPPGTQYTRGDYLLSMGTEHPRKKCPGDKYSLSGGTKLEGDRKSSYTQLYRREKK